MNCKKEPPKLSDANVVLVSLCVSVCSAAEERRVKKFHELEAEGLEDDEELWDKATEKARSWENWRDDHPRGIGNTKRI